MDSNLLATYKIIGAVLVNTGALSIGEVEALVADTDGFTRIVDDWHMQGNSFRSFSNISRTVVLVYLVLSVLMAIVVLLNLNVMFIEKKKRELIVLMINGFSVKDAKRYVYNDTIVLTILGIILGLILGSIMGFIAVGAIEPSTAALFRGVDLRALLVGTGVSAALSFVMSFIALRRIPAFKLTDINKA